MRPSLQRLIGVIIGVALTTGLSVTVQGQGPFAAQVQAAVNALTSGQIAFNPIRLAASAYANWGTTTGTNGYGIRDSAGTMQVKNSGGSWAAIATGGSAAPTDATYITQTANATLTNEQALSTLSSGIMRVATTTGVITALTDSSGIFANVSDETGGTGVLVGSISPALTTPTITTTETLTRDGIAATSTDGYVMQNTTAATGGVPQQKSPRMRICGTAYNSSSAMSETDCWAMENRPATVAGTTTSQWYLTASINGGAYSDVMSLTNAANLAVSTITATQVNMSSGFRSSANGTTITMPADGEVNFRNNATTGFASFRIASDIVYSWATPTITSGFSTSSPSIAGKASAFAVTIAATPGTTGVVAFNTTFTNVPSVNCTNTVTANAVQTVPTTTQVTLNGVWVANDIIRCIAIGY